MSTQEIVILVILVVVAVILLAALVALTGRRRKRQSEERRVQAGELRRAADSQAPDVRDSKLEAAEAEAEAELLRVRAERAEQGAAAVRRTAAVDQARHEDVVREADRLDPDVDHRADDYHPGIDLTGPDDTEGDPTRTTGPTGPVDPADTARTADPGGAHRA